MKNKIVVLGGDGFIGKHLVQKLAEQPGNDIYVFDRFRSIEETGTKPYADFENIHAIPGNYFNREEVASAVEHARYVFHLISTTTPAVSNNDPFIDIDTNVRNSVGLFQACADNGVEKVIFLSSGGTIYGESPNGKNKETEEPKPKSPYGIGKLAIEGYLRYFKSSRGLNYMVYRVANPYGPGQGVRGKQGVIPIFMDKLLNNEPITVLGDGTMERDYIYIDDLITLITETYDKDNSFETYNIGSGIGVSVNEIIDAIETGSNMQFERIHAPQPPTFVHKSVLDISRITEEFSVYPSTPLDEGIRKTWDYVRHIEDN